jgi:hypothetical protein
VGEVAVEPGEARAVPGQGRFQRPRECGVDAVQRVGSQARARFGVLEQVPQSVFLRGGREGGARDAGRERRDVRAPRRVEPFEFFGRQPPTVQHFHRVAQEA